MSSEEWSDSEDSNSGHISEADLAPIEPDSTHIELVKVDKSAVFDSQRFQEEVLNDISSISELFGVSFSGAASLLQNFRWNRERLTEEYFNNPAKLTQSMRKTTTASPQTSCQVCGETYNLFSLDCCHAFCRSCWSEHLSVHISEGQAANIPCLMARCNETVVNSEFVQQLVSAPLFKKYLKFKVAQIAETHPLWRRCPAAGCDYVIRVDSGKTSLRCRCMFCMCPRCNKESHLPARCDQIEKWLIKCKDDSETYNLLKVNTQNCPKCHSSIEKNGGCNHMTCWKCAYEFCWICNGDWQNHTNCNAYKHQTHELELTSLERYLHYFHRYTTHENSKKLETELRQRAVNQAIEFRQCQIVGIDMRILENATENLIECRRTLKYTYVLAFYMKNGPEKDLFEFLQADLEVATEELSRVLEIGLFIEFHERVRVLSNGAAK